MNWIIVIIGILLSIIIVFLANMVLLFSIHPIILIVFVVLSIIGIIAYNNYDNIFEFGSMFGVGWAVSFVGLILAEIFAWNEIIAPAVIRAVPVYTETIRRIVQNTDGTHLIVAILLAIEEPIIIGLLFPIVFEGIHLSSEYIIDHIHDMREEWFKTRYFDRCLNFVQNASEPVHEEEIINNIPGGDRKYQLKGTLLNALREYSCFDPGKKLYWSMDSYKKMKQTIENTLLNTSPRELEWLLYGVPAYNDTKFFAFKITAINELVKERVFVLETTTGSSLGQGGDGTALYRHINGSKIKSVVIEDDPDFD